MIFMAHADWMANRRHQLARPALRGLKNPNFTSKCAARRTSGRPPAELKNDLVDWPADERDHFVFER